MGFRRAEVIANLPLEAVDKPDSNTWMTLTVAIPVPPPRESNRRQPYVIRPDRFILRHGYREEDECSVLASTLVHVTFHGCSEDITSSM